MPTATADIRFAFCNVPRKVGPDNWRTCFLRTSAEGDIFGFNETHAGQRKVYSQEAKKAGFKMRAMRTPNPVFFDPDIYFARGTEVVRLHRELPSLARRFPGYNSARWATIVHLVHRKSSVNVTVVLTHLVPEGNKVAKRERAQARRVSFRALRRMQREAVSEGDVFVFMADTNHHSPFNLGMRFKWLREWGIDKVGYAVRRRDFMILAEGMHTFSAPTDHKKGVAGRVKVQPRR